MGEVKKTFVGSSANARHGSRKGTAAIETRLKHCTLEGGPVGHGAGAGRKWGEFERNAGGSLLCGTWPAYVVEVGGPRHF